MKFSIFTFETLKNLCIMHGQVFVMSLHPKTIQSITKPQSFMRQRKKLAIEIVIKMSNWSGAFKGCTLTPFYASTAH